jgi:Xaa-Pro aminopeptidase
MGYYNILKRRKDKMKNRIEKAREMMEEKGLDGFLVEKAVNRFYLTGFTGTAGRVLFTPENNYFITDFRYTEQANSQTDGYKIIEINRKVPEKLAKILKEDGVTKLGFEGKDVSYHTYQNYKKKLGENITLKSTKDMIQKIRLIKEESEINKIKKAVEITDKAFEHILDYIDTDKTERDIALELEHFMKRQGAEKNAFDFIVASGKRSSLPHGVASSKKIEHGDFITMDFGTYYQGYCSDMTRTIVVGEASQKQRDIYNKVLEAHNKVIEKIKPGMNGKEVDALARDIIKEAGYEDNFGHGLGHGIGVEVHEGPRASYTSEDELKPGMLVTDEPGIYIPDWGGVRIEDDLLITEKGCKPLNSSPKELTVV